MQDRTLEAPKKVLLFANTDWYLYNFRLPLAKALRENGYEVVLLSPDGPYGPRLREVGFRWEVAPMQRKSLNPLREVVFICWLARFLRREAPYFFHGFTIKCAVYGAMASRMTHVPARVNAVAGMGYVFTNRDMKALLLRPILRWFMQLAFNSKNSLLILQNPDDVRFFEDHRIVLASYIRLIKGSGVDCERFTEKVWNASGNEPLKVLLAARLQRDKGIAEYIEAVKILQSEGRTIQFYLAGAVDEGNPAAIDEKEVAEWVREGLLTWYGHVDDMPPLLRTMDVMTLPSYREGLPKGLIEAGASGLALVTTDVPGCREVVQSNGQDGLLVPPRDGRALADALRALDQDRGLLMMLGAAARKKALAEFNETVIIKQTLDAYKELEGC